MTEKIEIKNGKVICQMTGKQNSVRICKHCDHCRIALENHVTCTYSAEEYRKEHPFIQ